MKLETKRTLYLTKAEKKVLTDFYWSVDGDDTADDVYEMYNLLKALAEDAPPWVSPYNIVEITD